MVTFIDKMNLINETAVHMRKNIFELPHGKVRNNILEEADRCAHSTSVR